MSAFAKATGRRSRTASRRSPRSGRVPSCWPAVPHRLDGGGDGGPAGGPHPQDRHGSPGRPATSSFLGPPEIAGTEYAASDVNAAAGRRHDRRAHPGRLRRHRQQGLRDRDPRLLGEDVSAIIGAASSGTSLQFIDQVVGRRRDPVLARQHLRRVHGLRRPGLYFRTAPSGRAPGRGARQPDRRRRQRDARHDRARTTRTAPASRAFTKEAFEAAGGTVVAETTYNTGDTSFDAQISEVLAASRPTRSP